MTESINYKTNAIKQNGKMNKQQQQQQKKTKQIFKKYYVYLKEVSGTVRLHLSS